MVGMKMSSMKRMFFDSRAVTRCVDRTTRRVFSRFGAYVRTSARQSIRKRKRTSEPGKPPSSHVGLLKRMIFFYFDAARETVVIGPARLNQKTGDAPEALEHGGTFMRVRGNRRRRRRYRATYQARPFMGPAFEKEMPKLPQMWRDAIR